MYLLIFEPIFPSGFIYLAFTGMSLVDLLVRRNFIVPLSKVLALNLEVLAPLVFYSSIESWILVALNILFLYSSKT